MPWLNDAGSWIRSEGSADVGQLRSKQPFDPAAIVPLAFRPLDDVWVYWTSHGKLLNRSRPDFFEQVWEGNPFLSASQTGRKGGFNTPTIVDKLGDLHLQDPWSQFFPLYIRDKEKLVGGDCEPNIDHNVLQSLCQRFDFAPFEARCALVDEGGGRRRRRHLLSHPRDSLVPEVPDGYAAALKQDWPRIPIPLDRKTLSDSANVGRQVADLLLPDQSVRGVTTGRLRSELRTLAVPTKWTRAR